MVRKLCLIPGELHTKKNLSHNMFNAPTVTPSHSVLVLSKAELHTSGVLRWDFALCVEWLITDFFFFFFTGQTQSSGFDSITLPQSAVGTTCMCMMETQFMLPYWQLLGKFPLVRLLTVASGIFLT